MTKKKKVKDKVSDEGPIIVEFIKPKGMSIKAGQLFDLEGNPINV